MMAFKLTQERVQLYLMRGQDELLRACLPPPAQFWSCKPARVLLESLALWLGVRLRVVWSAADPAAGLSLGLTDEFGTGLRTVSYDVEPFVRRGRRPRRLHGIGDFRELRQLCLLDCLVRGGR